jgi:hypothetical protein
LPGRLSPSGPSLTSRATELSMSQPRRSVPTECRPADAPRDCQVVRATALDSSPAEQRPLTHLAGRDVAMWRCDGGCPPNADRRSRHSRPPLGGPTLQEPAEPELASSAVRPELFAPVVSGAGDGPEQVWISSRRPSPAPGPIAVPASVAPQDPHPAIVSYICSKDRPLRSRRPGCAGAGGEPEIRSRICRTRRSSRPGRPRSAAASGCS